MIESIYVIKDSMYFAWFALLLLFAGFCLSYVVDMFKIKALMWFPHWFVKIMSKHVNPKAKFLKIFLVIFLFNSISIFIYMLSGLLVIVPFVIAFFTGLNIGISVFIPPKHNVDGYEVRELGGPLHILRFMLFSTSVLVFEVAVFSLALGMGMAVGIAELSLGSMGPSALSFISELLALRIMAYITLCVPLLAVSAYMEASVIKGV
jgi:hypothetical protein